MSNIKFRKEDFICNDCGQTPKYIVADGKMTAPTIRKVEHLKELGPDDDDDDENILTQSTHFKDRVYLHRKKERDLVQKLMTDNMDIAELLICNICKPTSIASFMQVRSDEPLHTLHSFCQTLDSRAAENQQHLLLLARELPALFFFFFFSSYL